MFISVRIKKKTELKKVKFQQIDPLSRILVYMGGCIFKNVISKIKGRQNDVFLFSKSFYGKVELLNTNGFKVSNTNILNHISIVVTISVRLM